MCLPLSGLWVRTLLCVSGSSCLSQFGSGSHFFPNADPDPDPALQKCNVTLNLVLKKHYEEFALIDTYQESTDN